MIASCENGASPPKMDDFEQMLQVRQTACRGKSDNCRNTLYSTWQPCKNHRAANLLYHALEPQCKTRKRQGKLLQTVPCVLKHHLVTSSIRNNRVSLISYPHVAVAVSLHSYKASVIYLFKLLLRIKRTISTRNKYTDIKQLFVACHLFSALRRFLVSMQNANEAAGRRSGIMSSIPEASSCSHNHALLFSPDTLKSSLQYNLLFTHTHRTHCRIMFHPKEIRRHNSRRRSQSRIRQNHDLPTTCRELWWLPRYW